MNYLWNCSLLLVPEWNSLYFHYLLLLQESGAVFLKENLGPFLKQQFHQFVEVDLSLKKK